MRLTITILFCTVALSFAGLANNEDAIKESIAKIAKELEEKHPGRSKVKVAILQFRTNDNKLTPFNSYIQDELSLNYKDSKRFEVIDQNAMNRVADEFGWNLDMSNEYRQYSDLSEQIFRKIGVVPEVFIYGQINDNIETITLTGYLVPNGLKSTNIYSTQKFPSSAVTDRLLGKPVRKPKPEPKPEVVVVEKEVIVEKEVPVYIEKEVVVEKEVYIEKPEKHPRDNQNGFFGTVGDMDFELTEARVVGDKVDVELVVVNNKMDDRIEYMDSRFIDPDGNEFVSRNYSNTFRNRDLIEAVPIRGTITFKGNNIQRTQKMAVIEINVYGTGSRNLLGTLRFRNVPVVK